MDQGWLLVLLTSLTTLAGCCVIFTDSIYKFISPSLYAKHPFSIADNSTFLISSLALSSGCLLFSSLFILLPEGKDYISKLTKFDDDANATLFSVYYLSSYLFGIVICGLLNVTVHYFTSESIVHCVHEHDGGHHHDSQPHSHSHSTIDHPDASHSHSHTHAERTSSSSSGTDLERKLVDSNVNPNEVPSEGTSGSFETHAHTETTPLLSLGVDSQKKMSLVDLSLKDMNGTVLHGTCVGYDPLDNCCIIEDHHYHSDAESLSRGHIHVQTTTLGSTGPTDTTKSNASQVVVKHDSNLHYCDLPASENILFFDDSTKKLIKTNKQMSRKHSELQVFSPLMTVEDTVSSTINSANSIHSHSHFHLEEGHTHDSSNAHPEYLNHHHSISSSVNHGDTESQLDHKHHHHRITTPLSRLLSIGLQTVLAITLHKLPEGFIMYSTSKADPNLGLTIFLSMFIHNFVEGFTMTLPIYIALNSRFKALLISGLLGASAQPLGALVGYFLFRNNSLDMDSDTNNLLFGALISMTSGFLTIIGLQMFASSIAFGGKQGHVLTCACIGILLISISLILVDES